MKKCLACGLFFRKVKDGAEYHYWTNEKYEEGICPLCIQKGGEDVVTDKMVHLLRKPFQNGGDS